MTTPEPPLSAPPASSQALPADQDTPPAFPALPRDVWDAAEQAEMDADAYRVDPREAMASVAYAAGVAAGEARGRTAAAADLRHRIQRVWPDPMGQWSAEQADAGRAVKEAMLRALTDGLPAPTNTEESA